MPRWSLVREVAAVFLALVAVALLTWAVIVMALRGQWLPFSLTLVAVVLGGGAVALGRWDPERPRPVPGDEARPVRMPDLRGL